MIQRMFSNIQRNKYKRNFFSKHCFLSIPGLMKHSEVIFGEEKKVERKDQLLTIPVWKFHQYLFCFQSFHNFYQKHPFIIYGIKQQLLYNTITQSIFYFYVLVVDTKG